jgi:hypothetical protein
MRRVMRAERAAEMLGAETEVATIGVHGEQQDDSGYHSYYLVISNTLRIIHPPIMPTATQATHDQKNTSGGTTRRSPCGEMEIEQRPGRSQTFAELNRERKQEDEK